MRRTAIAVAYWIAFAVLGYWLVGDELHSWRGVLIGALLVWGTIEMLVGLAALRANDSGWRWTAALHATLAFAAVLSGILIARSWRWIALAAFVLTATWIYSRIAPEDDDED